MSDSEFVSRILCSSRTHRARWPKETQNIFEFFTVQDPEREHASPLITGQSNSSWPGLSAPAIRTSKTLSPSRLPHISKCCNAGPRRPRSLQTLELRRADRVNMQVSRRDPFLSRAHFLYRQYYAEVVH